ncbi:class I SAM-dependent methyltransferase [Caulobacter sp. KR2-114]|uniref:class I SAM-dependent methyltransferase n=1 Tax=Caulobacter sp. KR2-114 TaxID=3400912 RepID=UPI003C009DF8
MTRSQHTVVTDQFGPRAAAYVQSAVHAQGEDLDRLEAIAHAAAPATALDVGTGGGHVAYRLAAHAGQVTACDLSEEMLAAVAETARGRGIGNLTTRAAPAERLPFEDGAFDLVATRFSAHHWHDVDAGLREMRRVARAGATAVIVDAYSPGHPLLDTHLQAVELLRDTSHVRDYTAAEWQGVLARAGFAVREARTWRIRLDFASWIARMRTPDDNVRAIRALQAAAPAEARAHFAVEADGSFMLDVILFEATAA